MRGVDAYAGREGTAEAFSPESSDECVAMLASYPPPPSVLRWSITFPIVSAYHMVTYKISGDLCRNVRIYGTGVLPTLSIAHTCMVLRSSDFGWSIGTSPVTTCSWTTVARSNGSTATGVIGSTPPCAMSR